MTKTIGVLTYWEKKKCNDCNVHDKLNFHIMVFRILSLKFHSLDAISQRETI